MKSNDAKQVRRRLALLCSCLNKLADQIASDVAYSAATASGGGNSPYVPYKSF